MEFMDLVLLTVILLARGIVHSDALQIECHDLALERGSRAKVSCKYDLNFIAVFWYRDEAGNPFLRLEEGRPTTEEGFEISSSGAMIISNVQVNHEGNYRISVLDADGVSNSETLLISVTVTLLGDPLLQSCSSYRSKVCADAEDRENVLICETTETRPAVDFVWKKLSSSQPVRINSSLSTTAMNETTGLFHSSSTLHFNPLKFSLQLYTCEAIGSAVNASRTSSLFVTGLKDVRIQEKNTQLITHGSSVKIKCPKTGFSLGMLHVTYIDGTSRTLTKLYPGDDDVFCELGSRCTVSGDRDVTISDLTYKDEGTYECVCSDGMVDRKYVTIVNTMIKPTPEEVIIDGCEDSHRCEKNVDLKGTLQSSVFGARPPVKIFCEVAKKTDSAAFIFNERTSIEEHKEEGTFDTLYTIEYKIPECSNPVHVMCYVSSDSVHKDITAANILLITDPSTCHYGRRGLIVFLLVVFLIIFVAILIGIIGRKKVLKFFERQRKKTKDSDKENDNQSSQNHESQGLIYKENLERGSELEVHEPYFKTNDKLELTSENDIHLPDSQQEKFKQMFKPFISKVIKGEGTLDEFISILETFSKENEVKQLTPLLSNFLVKDEQAEKDLTVFVEFLDRIKPNKWISFLDFVNIINELTAAKKLSGDRTLQLFEEYTKNETINLATYVNLTGSLLALQCITVTSLLRAFKSIVDAKEQCQSRLSFAEAFLKYYRLDYMTEKVAVKGIVSFANSSTIPLHYFFQSIYLQYGEESKSQHNPKFFSIFKELLEKMRAEESYVKLFPMSRSSKMKPNLARKPIYKFMEGSVDCKGQDISSIFIEVVICSVETEDDFKTCKQMLELAQKKKLLPPDGCTDAFVSCVRNEWIIEDFQTSFLDYILSKSLIKTETQQSSCFQVLLEKNGLESFLRCLNSCYKKELITNTFFSDLVLENIKSDKISKDEYRKTLKRLEQSDNVTKQEVENFAKVIKEAAKKDPELEMGSKFPLLGHKYSFPKKTTKT